MEPIESPFKLPVVTKEVIEKVKEMTDATCVLVVISDQRPEHICTPETCTGHYLNINLSGFTSNQVLGIAQMIADEGGYKLVRKDNGKTE